MRHAIGAGLRSGEIPLGLARCGLAGEETLILDVTPCDVKNVVVRTTPKVEQGNSICGVDTDDPRQDFFRITHAKERPGLLGHNAFFERIHRLRGTKRAQERRSEWERVRTYERVQLRHQLRAIERAVCDAIEKTASSIGGRLVDNNRPGLGERHPGSGLLGRVLRLSNAAE